MSTDFPTSLPSHTAPSSGQKLNNPSQVDIVTKLQQEQVAIATKLGTGNSTATSGKLLRGTGAGSTAFDKTAPTGEIIGDTDTQVLTNKTLTSPTITTPTIDYITDPLFRGLWDGWIGANETWTYKDAASVNSIVDTTSYLNIGDKIRFKQGGAYKYFYLINLDSTSLNIYAGTDNVVTDAPITDIYYSKASSPVGFPDWFNYTPTITGWVATPTNASNFKMNGREVTVHFKVSGTSNATSAQVTVPITTVAGKSFFSYGYGADNNVGKMMRVGVGDRTTLDCSIVLTGSTPTFTAWTNSGTKIVDGIITYEI